MKTFYFGDELSEYKLEYTISITGKVHIMSCTKLRGIKRKYYEIWLVLFDHLKELGIKYTSADASKLKEYA